MDLISEVLELTLAYQRDDATDEECARLERLLIDNPQAVDWYLRVLGDTLTLRAAASRRPESKTSSTANEPSQASDVGVLTAHSTREDSAPREAGELRFAAIGGRWRSWAPLVTAATLLLVVTGGLLWNLADRPAAQNSLPSDDQSARVVNVSNVLWSPGAKAYGEWSFVAPGESLKFEQGLVNLFLDNGAELLIEGPADVDFVSIEKVFARKGKLAARVSPGAIGFSIETPHANVIDRGTSFGLSVDENSRTDVVVYEGKVDFDVMGDNAPPRRRLERGEGLSVNRLGILSRITTVGSTDFLEPPQVRASGKPPQPPVITAVSDNVQSLETTKYYRVIPGGFREDCRAYVDRTHEWNGVDKRGLPPFLVGGDYLMTYNDDKIVTEFEIAVSLGQPASLYVIIDDRVPPPEWLSRTFVNTHWDVGSDEGYEGRDINNAVGAGKSIDHTCSVWRHDVLEASTVVLGALSSEEFALPAEDVGRSMYAVVAVPLASGDAARTAVRKN